MKQVPSSYSIAWLPSGKMYSSPLERRSKSLYAGWAQKRVKCAHGFWMNPGRGQVLAAGAPADLHLPLEDGGLQTGLLQIAADDAAVMSPADDDRVVCRVSHGSPPALA